MPKTNYILETLDSNNHFSLNGTFVSIYLWDVDSPYIDQMSTLFKK